MDFFDILRKESGGNTDEDVRTTDLEFNEMQFRFAMLMEEDGERLIDLLVHGEYGKSWSDLDSAQFPRTARPSAYPGGTTFSAT